MMECDYHGQRRRETLDLRLASLRRRLFLDVFLTILRYSYWKSSRFSTFRFSSFLLAFVISSYNFSPDFERYVGAVLAVSNSFSLGTIP